MFLEVHVGTPIEKCREINGKLLENENEDGGYASDIFEQLIYRFEEPNGMTRWDSPLFTVPYDDASPPGDEIWAAVVGSEGTVKTVKPNQATVMVCLEGTPPAYSVQMADKAIETSRRLRLPVRAGQNITRNCQLDIKLAKRSPWRRRRRNKIRQSNPPITILSSLATATSED